MDPSKFFCVHPFISGVIAPRYFKACCADSKRLRPKNYMDYTGWWNHEDTKEMRRNIMDGEMPEVCTTCVAQGNLMRLYGSTLIPTYEHLFKDELFPEGEAVNKPKRITVVPSNLCNLACDFCSEDYSINLGDKIHRELTGVDFEIMEQLAPEIEILNITGGEPFLDKRNTLKILEIFYPYRDKIDLIINTNGTIKWKEWMSIIFEFKEVTLAFSIDGELGVHCRHRGIENPSVLVNNIREYLENGRASSSNHRIGIHASVGPNTINSMGEFVKDLETLYKNNLDFVSMVPVLTPFHAGLKRIDTRTANRYNGALDIAIQNAEASGVPYKVDLINGLKHLKNIVNEAHTSQLSITTIIGE